MHCDCVLSEKTLRSESQASCPLPFRELSADFVRVPCGNVCSVVAPRSSCPIPRYEIDFRCHLIDPKPDQISRL